MLENRITEMLDLRDNGISLARIAEKLGLSKRTIRAWDAYINSWEKYQKVPAIRHMITLREEKALQLLADNYKKQEKRQNYLIGQRCWHKRGLIKNY
ncbi:MAG: helix-turn-helix domain-containing protein [Candidatus Nanoarchaeia archaeon]|nr:helix-turn-helix domain-containing protein [Candidatus Nanoarchaeia archaeon]